MKIIITLEDDDWSEVTYANDILNAEGNLETMARHYHRNLVEKSRTTPENNDEPYDKFQGVETKGTVDMVEGVGDEPKYVGTSR